MAEANQPVKKDQSDSKQLKQRLLGAAVLVALAVIIIPELVKKPIPQTQVTSVDMPPAPTLNQAKPTLSVKLPTPEPQPLVKASEDTVILESTQSAGSQAANMIDGMQTTTGSGSSLSVDEVDAAVPLPTTPASQATTLTSQTTAAATNSDSNTVDTSRASSLAKTPATATSGAASSQRSTVSGAARTSSSARQAKNVALPKIELISPKQYNPQPSRTAATRTSGQQNLAAYNPAQSSNANSNWIVQAGSFAVARNANLLRDQLRARNFPASLRAVTVNGQTRYRVNVGPYQSRTASEQVRQRLQQEARLNGSVRKVN